MQNTGKIIGTCFPGTVTYFTPVDLCEQVDYVPEMIQADRLLTGFRKDSSGVRVVVDEFGGFVGVIGAEAVLAVLAGWWRKPT